MMQYTRHGKQKHQKIWHGSSLPSRIVNICKTRTNSKKQPMIWSKGLELNCRKALWRWGEEVQTLSHTSWGHTSRVPSHRQCLLPHLFPLAFGSGWRKTLIFSIREKTWLNCLHLWIQNEWSTWSLSLSLQIRIIAAEFCVFPGLLKARIPAEVLFKRVTVGTWASTNQNRLLPDTVQSWANLIPNKPESASGSLWEVSLW